LDPNSSHAKVCELVPAGARVLDVGCGSGELAAWLSARGAQVWGVDINSEALAAAKPHCVQTRVADLEHVDIDELFPELQFDAVVFADVLEHVREPWRLLESSRSVLAAGGRVVASIPNFSHAAVRLAVLDGAMPYRTLGILDDTHLRFFTLASIASLFAESGFRVEAVERTIAPFGAVSDLVPDVRVLRAPPEIEQRVRSHPEAETLQFVVRALPVPGTWDMSALRGRLHDVEAHAQEQAVGIENLERELAERAERLAAALQSMEEASERAARAGAERDEKAAAAEKLHDEVAALQMQLDEAKQALKAQQDLAHIAETTRAAALAQAQSLHATVIELEHEATRLREAASAAELERADALEQAGHDAARAAEADLALRDMHARIDGLEVNLEEVYAELAQLERAHGAELDLHRANIEKLEERLRESNDALTRHSQTIAERDQAIAAYEQTIAAYEQTIAEQARAAAEEAARERTVAAAEHARLRADAERAEADLREQLESLSAAGNVLFERVERAERQGAAAAARLARIASAVGATGDSQLEEAVALLCERSRQDAFARLALEHQIADAREPGEQFWRAEAV
jgi:methionine biosynthesis protein MetW